MSRFQTIAQQVIDLLKAGHAPVVIECWKSFWSNNATNDKLWNELFPPIVCETLRNTNNNENKAVIVKAGLKSLSLPFFEACITLQITSKDGKSSVESHRVLESAQTKLIYWGHRDRNYLKLFFTYLGYNVSEGNVAGKYGLLINFGR